MKKKHIMLMTAFIMMFSMMMLSFGNVYADDNTLPDGAPFTAIYIGAGSPLAVESEDKTLNGDNVTLYQITVPEGADNAVVFFPMDLGIFDESYCVFGSSFVDGELSDGAVQLDAATEDGENVMVLLQVDDYLSEDES